MSLVFWRVGMGKMISEHFFSFEDRNLPAKQVTDYIAYSQDEFYFRLAVLKNSRVERLKDHFSRIRCKKIFISATLSGFDFKLAGWDVEYLEKGFFHCLDYHALEQKLAYLEDSIVVVNNNDVAFQEGMPHYAEFYTRSNRTIFVAWDFDNHHWLELSTFLAAHSDLYLPAHHENLYLLTRYNWLTAGPIYAGTIQWSRRFLTEHLPLMLTAERSDAPLGMHIPYPAFRFRMQVIATLNQHYPSIGFSDSTFHERTTEDRLKEWYSHKCHWVVPVLNDVPIRMFDALVTGGIPIVPESLRFLSPVNEISRDHILFYGPQDILEPKKIVAKANEIFDEGGVDKMVERHIYALNYHHATTKIHQILTNASETFSLDLRAGD